MGRLTSDSWLSSDHTFKVAADIGFFWNNRWVKVYDSLFTVFNEIVTVLAWLLTKRTKFENIENVLNNLQERFSTKGKILNCTLQVIAAAGEINSILFLVMISVKLDPHFMQSRECCIACQNEKAYVVL